jgi:hypothetical protein
VLRGQDILRTSFPDADVYSVALYYRQAEADGTRAWMLLDRNVFARIVELAKGRPATPDHRVAAAVMAFGQCADMAFEPALAVYEGVATAAQNDAPGDLALFRAADNVHPSEFADIALGKCSRLHTNIVPAKVEPKLISTLPIQQYSFVYPPVLKMGLIELEGGPMADRMRRFLDWTYATWYMSAPATILAAMCFSGTPPGHAFKNLRQRDRNLALCGLRNCAWDLTYVTWWGDLVRLQSQDNCLRLFCTRDKALGRVAQLMLVEPNSGSEDIEGALRQLLGASVYDHYVDLIARQDHVSRPVNQKGFSGVERGREIVSVLEQELQRQV